MINKTIKIHNKEYQVNCYEENGKTVVELPDDLKKLDGYGTHLKPAYEPVVLCRKPLDKGGYVNSVLKYGTSGLNIDGGRIGTDEDNRRNARGGENGLNGSDTFKIRERLASEQIKHDGRFPANFGLICTCEQEPCECVDSELDRQSGKGFVGHYPKTNKQGQSNAYGKFNGQNQDEKYLNKGGASRFFYTAKASSKERELGLEELELKISGGMQGTADQTLLTGSGNTRNNMRYNNHPTVKPIKLIEYLATLALPPIENSNLLIPFSGVGSEIIGAHLAGWNNITGIEISSDYIDIANKRLEYWTQYDNYDDALKSKKLVLDKQLELL